MNCILHTKFGPVHSPVEPPTSFFHLLPSIKDRQQLIWPLLVRSQYIED